MTDGPGRFGRLVERDDGRDLPYYDGRPVAVPASRWAVVVVACAVGFAVLSLVASSDQWLELVPRLVFVGLPALALVWATRGHWRPLFRPVHARDVGAMVVFWLLNLAVSAVVALLVSGGDTSTLTDNAATDGLEGAGQLVGFYVGTAVQLMGEELFTILPFLALLSVLHARGVARRPAVLLAWLVTSVWFGAAHLPTYDWNLLQAIVVIGSARVVLTLAYLRTKNLWVSFGAHVLNDWTTFTIVILAAG